jgi:hypothetical protein
VRPGMTATVLDERAALSSQKAIPKTKKDQLSLAQQGIDYLRTGPILTTPGGWGLRNPEPKGPGQRRTLLSQSSWAVAGQKWGGIMIPLTIP